MITINNISAPSFGSIMKSNKEPKTTLYSRMHRQIRKGKSIIEYNIECAKSHFKKNKNDDSFELQNNYAIEDYPMPPAGSEIIYSDTPDERIINPTSSASSSFPFPKFGDNPTSEEKTAYVDSIMKFLEVPDKELNIQAIEAVGKYGTDKQADKLFGKFSADHDDEIQQALARAYADLNNPLNADYVIEPLINFHDYSSETYLECLKTLKKIVRFTKEDTQKDKDIILRPIQKLLNHEDEKVRRMSQETIDCIMAKSVQ